MGGCIWTSDQSDFTGLSFVPGRGPSLYPLGHPPVQASWGPPSQLPHDGSRALSGAAWIFPVLLRLLLWNSLLFTWKNPIHFENDSSLLQEAFWDRLAWAGCLSLLIVCPSSMTALCAASSLLPCVLAGGPEGPSFQGPLGDRPSVLPLLAGQEGEWAVSCSEGMRWGC